MDRTVVSHTLCLRRRTLTWTNAWSGTQPCGREADMWSMGVVLYLLLYHDQVLSCFRMMMMVCPLGFALAHSLPLTRLPWRFPLTPARMRILVPSDF